MYLPEEQLEILLENLDDAKKQLRINPDSDELKDDIRNMESILKKYGLKKSKSKSRRSSTHRGGKNSKKANKSRKSRKSRRNNSRKPRK